MENVCNSPGSVPARNKYLPKIKIKKERERLRKV